MSLRSLLLVVFVIAGWLGWMVHRARVQHAAVAAIQKTGGRVWYDWEHRGRARFPTESRGGRGGSLIASESTTSATSSPSERACRALPMWSSPASWEFSVGWKRSA